MDSLGYNPEFKMRNGQTNPVYKFAKAVQLNSFLSEDDKDDEIERVKATGNIFFDKKSFYGDDGDLILDVYDDYFMISRKDHQQIDGQCGMYAMYTIMHYVLSESAVFLAVHIKDDFMRLMRRECFLNYALNGAEIDLDENVLDAAPIKSRRKREDSFYDHLP